MALDSPQEPQSAPAERPKQSGADFGGFVAWVAENGTFALGMLLMFSRTTDLLTAFAPRTIFGYSGMELYYGLACGALIEGALFIMKLTLGRAKNLAEWLWSVLIVVTPFLISALAQVFDSFTVRNTMAQQPEYIQVFVQWFIPSIPTLIIGLLIGKSIFSSVPRGAIPSGMPVLLAPKEPAHSTGFVGRFALRAPMFLSRKRGPVNPTRAADQRKIDPSQ